MTCLDPRFARSDDTPTLHDDEIHVWFFPEWRNEGRGAESLTVRTRLARYLATDAGEVAIDYDARGKAHLRGGALQFNVSHSASALLLAVSREQVLGVDLERQRRPRRVLDLARRWFAPREADALARLPEAQRQMAFLRLWTCKEAVVKAAGAGLAVDLHGAIFELDDHGDVRRAADPSWQIATFAPADAFHGAVAWRGEPRPVRYLLGAVAHPAIDTGTQSG